jgi:Matrixin
MEGSWIRGSLGALLAYLAISIAPAAAAAANDVPQRWPVNGPAMQAARQLAIEHWSIDPCHGDVAITWGKLPGDENAESSWTNQFYDYGDPDRNTLCQVTFNPAQDWDWPKLCTVFVHEFGHLAGNAHSSDPNDVMFPYYVGRNLPECERVSPAESQAPTAPRRGHPSPATKRASQSKAYRAGTTRHPKRTGTRSRPR